jgi:undecaprenyl-diphosphatase
VSHLTYLEAIVVGLVQGVSELFPVSSLGHSVLLPAWIGGGWARDLTMTTKDSPYLSILVAMHLATAVALAIFYWRDWRRLLLALVSSIRYRRLATAEERLIWLMIVGSIPVGLVGLAADQLRTVLGTPMLVAIFLILNGGVLYSAELMRRRRATSTVVEDPMNERTVVFGSLADVSAQETVVLPAVSDDPAVARDLASDRRLSRLSWGGAMMVGAGEILGLLPGFSRSGGTIATGLFRGLAQEDAVRFAFLLATPAILGAGLLKVPALFTPTNHGVLGPAVAGSVVAGVAAYFSVRFLTRYFETRTVTPFAIYSVVVGVASAVYFAVR